MDPGGIHIPPEIHHYEKKVYDQRQLIELSKALNSQLNLNELIDSILNSCLAQVQTFQAGVLLKDGVDAETMTLQSEFKGFEIVNPTQYSISMDSPLVEDLKTNPRALTWEKFSTEPRYGAEAEILRDLDLKLLIPLPAKGEIHGIILLGAKATGVPYPHDEISFLEDLASLAGIAANNARLYELATTDMMTGLKIHHFFQSRLREERRKALKKDKPLSFFLTDVDHFKQFNDTHGHQAGDEVLKEVAAQLMAGARKIDTAARYGGEEFCLIMPQTRAEEALEIAEKIRRNIENLVVTYQGKELRVTISVGIAQFEPEADLENKDLIEKADKALYKCKKMGRNQSQIYQETIPDAPGP